MKAKYEDIRAMIRTVVQESDLNDPGEIATAVVRLIPDENLRPILTIVMREFVRIELHSFGRWQPAAGPDQPRPAGSANVAAVRAWAQLLRKPEAVEGNVWKQFGECDRDDLVFLAADRRQNAARSIAAAERFEKYVAAVDECDVDVVADLPDDVIASIENGDHQ